jgi:hypothetical protein
MMRTGACPDDTELESYFYDILPSWKSKRVRIHMVACESCRSRLRELEKFDQFLSSIPSEDPPAELSARLAQALDSWESPSTVVTTPNIFTLLNSSKVRWAFCGLVIAVTLFVQFRFPDLLPAGLHLGLFSWWVSIKEMVELIRTGTIWANLSGLFHAVEMDALAVFQIVIGSVLPMQVMNVLVFGGVFLVVLVYRFSALSRWRR